MRILRAVPVVLAGLVLALTIGRHPSQLWTSGGDILSPGSREFWVFLLGIFIGGYAAGEPLWRWYKRGLNAPPADANRPEHHGA